MLIVRKRRYGLLLLIGLLVLCLTACGDKEQQGTPAEISYLNKSETKIVPEVHYLQGTSTKEMIVEVLTLLSAVPNNKELEATLPGGINIVNYAFEGTQVTVALGEKYKELSKTTEVLTRAAIVRSLTSIPEVEYVMLTVNGEPLLDTMGNAVGIMTADMFIDYAGQKNTDSYEQAKVRLYFANETGDKLIAVNRSLAFNMDISNISMERLVVEQLLAGPASDESYPTINPATKLLGITVKDGVCYLNFSKDILTPVNNVTSDVTIYSIVNSLVELSNVNKVEISIEGNKELKFLDKYELTTLYERNLDLVQ
ncbi:MAG: GerMN domain-containing protein [Lachnospiraceae bacterium]|nr:GerMN domain-containing protein [Lachnospiraceae bacterium]MBQ6995699.1 GerMN domain-containing protein [Lachnospiraceae bacterium]